MAESSEPRDLTARAAAVPAPLPGPFLGAAGAGVSAALAFLPAGG